MKKTGIPKGTRDFTPADMARRRYIFRTIEDVFRLYGYQAIETPAIENLDTLLGKYGEEGDKLLFKILNSGDFLAGVDPGSLAGEGPARAAVRICEKGLRYDLTVPFARFVVQHRNEITFPFKRYQVQPVWRADRPQKGRYREFYQCDADIIGSRSLLNELELVEIIDHVFRNLGLKILVKVNNRKILAGIAAMLDQADRLTDITTALDKLDKIGKEKVIGELRERGLPEQAIRGLQPIFTLEGDHVAKLDGLKGILQGDDTGMQGIEEIETLFGYLDHTQIAAEVQLDLSLARGLNYYTGAIIEVMSKEVEIGSLCGGGRYDDLTGIFGMEDVSGVGISFGADRIFDVLQQLGLFPEEAVRGTKLLFVNFGRAETEFILSVLPGFREAGIESEIYPDPVKLKKQLAYANSNSIPWVALVGANELAGRTVTLKNMDSGQQNELSVADAIAQILHGGAG